MAAVYSTMLPLGTLAPFFRLTNIDYKTVTLTQFQGAPALLVMFICNHCPYVKYLREEIVALASEYQPRGVAFVGINSNDAEAYPEDSPRKMVEFAKESGFTFPYLFDDTQGVAKAYRAACTPDFFLFDSSQKLVYRGQYDASRPNNGLPLTGAHLKGALNAVLEGKPVNPEQFPSMGCNIKWKPGNEPEYYRAPGRLKIG